MILRDVCVVSVVLALTAAAPLRAQVDSGGVNAAAFSADGFEPLGAWSVRIDQVENPREDRLVHVYVTLRNDSVQRLLQTEGINLLHEDSTGITTQSSQSLKARPGYPELFGSPPPVTLPGQELRAKFVFDRNRGAQTARIVVEEGVDHSAAFDF